VQYQKQFHLRQLDVLLFQQVQQVLREQVQLV
jgi:hypothetical protein